MSDTATDVNRSQNTEISAEYLSQLRELAESQGWSLDGTLRRALAVVRNGSCYKCVNCGGTSACS